MNDRAPNSRPQRATHRKLAEWVTLSASIILVAAVAVFLIYQSTRPQTQAVPVEVRVKVEQAKLEAGRYIVPIEVHNRGTQTVSNLKIQVRPSPAGEARDAGDAGGQNDLLIDYLPANLSQTLYLYFDRDPRQLKIEAQPVAYELR